MAGHSKWANIKHRKGAQDAKRGKLFTRFIREITVAAKMGGADLGSNPRLRAAVDKALAGNMTRDTIDRAIKRGAGSGEADNLEEVRYEGYGIAGMAVIVDCLTDNRNRTVAEVRHAFSKAGGNLGTDGSVAYMFSKQGQILFASESDEDTIMEAALEAGAEDVITESDGSIEVRTTPDDFSDVLDAIKATGQQPESAQISMIPANTVAIADVETAEKLLRLIDTLEDLDDVQEVYTNADIPDDIIAQMS